MRAVARCFRRNQPALSQIDFATEAGLILEWVLATRPVIDTDHGRITNATGVPRVRFILISEARRRDGLSRGNEVRLARSLRP
jgi:hypothetical protein